MVTNTQHEASATEPSGEYSQYRAMSGGAVAALVLGMLSIIVLLTATTSIEACLMVTPIPLAGIVVGVRSMLRIRSMPHEMTGFPLAAAGTLLSSGFLSAGLSLAWYTYLTEVPEGVDARISFAKLQPDEREQAQGMLVPPDVKQLQGKRVFIKGYMRPSSQRYQLDRFLLVRDNNECCFGDLAKVKYFDQIQVYLKPPLRADYSRGVWRAAGTLLIDPAAARPGSNRPVFTLAVDYLK